MPDLGSPLRNLLLLVFLCSSAGSVFLRMREEGEPLLDTDDNGNLGGRETTALWAWKPRWAGSAAQLSTSVSARGEPEIWAVPADTAFVDRE